ncbi:MAG: YkgJ family cysteine cluster protein [Candidatus Thermoplasmatota archaeon]|nr:YkgJ family cysteine cluster protein [Candidatus Thermoplasmatota archaeon]
MLKQNEIIDRLFNIYSLIPTMNCSHCHSCCGPIFWFEPEEILIRSYLKEHHLDYIQLTHEEFEKNGMHCPYLSKNGCLIYPVRPIVCRLQGVTQELLCSHNTKSLMSAEDVRKVKTQIFSLLKDMGSQQRYYGTRNIIKDLDRN